MRRAVAIALGFGPDTGREWFRHACVVIPPFVTKLPSGRCLSFAEREEIFAGVERGDSLRADGAGSGPRALDRLAGTAPQHAASVPGLVGSATRAGSTPDAALGLSTQPRADPGGTLGCPTQAGQAGHECAATPAGPDQTGGTVQSPPAGTGAARGVPRQSRDAGLARDDLSVDLRAGPGRLASRAGGLPAHRPGVTAAAPKPPGAPHPDSGYGQHQRAARRSGGPRRAVALGTRPLPGQER